MNPNNHLPNLIIGGVHKAGTTSLHTYLSMHPDVCGSLIKELAFLLPSRYHQSVPDDATYSSHFKNHKGEKYILETTPSYLYGGLPLIGIHRQPARLCGLSVRDPATAIHSKTASSLCRCCCLSGIAM